MSRQSAQAVIALFDSAQALMDAIPKVRATYHGRLEAYTPYPVHGIEKALGIGKSWVGWIVLGMGLLGLCAGFGLQTWVFTTEYPLVFGGKPVFGWPAFIPVTFETTVLLSAFGAVFGMLLVANRYPHLSHPLLSTKAMKSITRDRFALVCEAEKDREIDEDACREVLSAAGGQDLEVVYESAEIGTGELLSPKGVTLGLLICVIAGFGMKEIIIRFPALPPMNNMDEVFRQDAQDPSAFFADGFGMRQPVAGTVARGFMPAVFETAEEADGVLANPMRMTMASLEHGKVLYDQHCMVCHGALGTGEKMMPAYGGVPANLHSQRLREVGDGHLYHVITHGKNTMAGYGKDIAPAERWDLVNYLRALQRSQDATDDDLRLARTVAANSHTESHHD